MIRASELSFKTRCLSCEICNTPPVLKESDLHIRSEQNRQRIDTPVIQARMQFHHRNTSQLEHGAERRTQPEETLVITIFEMCP